MAHESFTVSDHDTTARHPLGTVVPHDDHGNLSGLGDDDHPQYLNTARHDTTDRHPYTVLKTATGESRANISGGSTESVVLNAYSFAPNIWAADTAHLRVTGHATESTDQVARLGIHNSDSAGHYYAVRWRYITASNNPQIWVVQDEITGEIIGIWHSDDPPEVETDNPFRIVPLEFRDKNGKVYGVTNYVEIPGFLDEFRATLRAGFDEVKKRYKLREKSTRPKLLPKHIRFCKLEKV